MFILVAEYSKDIKSDCCCLVRFIDRKNNKYNNGIRIDKKMKLNYK